VRHFEDGDADSKSNCTMRESSFESHPSDKI